ncbi:MAG: agmatinase family protein [Sphingosinicella sp.]
MAHRVALIGLPTDINSSFRRGPARAPAIVRAMIRSEKGNMATEVGGEIGLDFDLSDRGDVALAEDEADFGRIEQAVAGCLDAVVRPICIGGDHSVTWPILKAIAAAHGRVSILHFDAHPDLYDALDGNRRSHASPFARIMEDGLANRLVQVGIRTLNAEQRAQAERFGVEIVPMRGFSPASVPALDGPIYVSIDLDGLDPAFAPGVSHHEPGGLSVRDIIDSLDRLAGPVIGGDVVEYNPDCDVGGMTATVAAKLVRELAALAART